MYWAAMMDWTLFKEHKWMQKKTIISSHHYAKSFFT